MQKGTIKNETMNRTSNTPQTPSKGSQSRRNFMKASAAAVAVTPIASLSRLTAGTTILSSNVRQLETDVLVCGGGCAGIAAALSAARSGAKTILIEKAPFAGGIITSVGLPYFDGIADIKERRVVVRGIALELLSKSGVCAPDASHVKSHNPTIPNTFEFKVLLDREIRACGDNLKVLFNSFACDAETKGDRIRAVTVANKDGLVRIQAKSVIDCTGDADVAAWAGADTEQSKEVQPLTLHFRIGHVKRELDRNLCRQALINAQERGELPYFYGPGINFMFGNDEVYIHGIRVPANPTDAADLTRAEMQGRSDAHAMFRAWKSEVPAFADAYFIEAYPWIGVRESRRLIGQYMLNEEDVMQSRSFDDAVATGCWYLDLHPNKTTLGSANDFAPEKVQPGPYDIPYRTLQPRNISNLLVAGRCHSATRQAHSSTRVTATAMALGEAAGCAAALAGKMKTDVASVPGIAVRDQLSQQKAGPFTF